MYAVGESSQMGVDELRDIHVVHEELRTVEQVPTVAVEGQEFEPESDPEEEVSLTAVSPIAEEALLESDPEEDPSEVNPMVSLLVDRNTTLEVRVQHLEEENHTFQMMEEQYKTVVHELLASETAAKEKVVEYEDSIDHIGSLVQTVAAQNLELRAELDEARQELWESGLERQQLQVQKEALEVYWEDEIQAYNEMEANWEEAKEQRDEARDRVHDLENEVRGKNARMDMMSYAFESGFGRWESRIYHHPAEEGRTQSVLSRKRMIEIGQEELADAKRRGMLRR